MTRGNWFWCACLATLLTAGVARADDAADTAKVLGKLHRSNQTEIEMGKMALDHGASKGVKDFAKMLAKDHAAADKKVARLAKDERVDLKANTPPSDCHPDTIHTGAAFDNAFARNMRDDHEKDVAEVTAALDSTADPRLKKLLTELLPVLEKHKLAAQNLVELAEKDKS
jgi:putative membrane protein